MLSQMNIAEKLDSFFGVRERGSSIRTEVRAGIITFIAMSYILVVNPTMLTDAGMDWNAVFTATVISAATATLIMALYAKYPIAQAPGMGINAFFTYTVVIVLGYTWQQALAAVFMSGILFLLMSVGGLRKRILDAIPRDLRIAITAGIGCFIVFVGLQGSGIIVGNPSTLVMLGNLSDPKVMLAIFGIVFTVLLHLRKVNGSLLIGILATAILGMVIGIVEIPTAIVNIPAVPYFGAFIEGLETVSWDLQFAFVIISFLFVDFFDCAGTILAIGERAELLDDNGNLRDGNKALASDAVGTVLGATIGVSPVTSYIESSTGIESGGRTGIMTVVVGLLFLLALLFGPVLSVISFECTVAALILVGATMLAEIGKIEWEDPAVALTALMTILFMLFTYSITNGIGMGIIMYCLSMAATHRGKDVHPIIYIMALVFIMYFAIMTTFY